MPPKKGGKSASPAKKPKGGDKPSSKSGGDKPKAKKKPANKPKATEEPPELAIDFSTLRKSTAEQAIRQEVDDTMCMFATTQNNGGATLAPTDGVSKPTKTKKGMIKKKNGVSKATVGSLSRPSAALTSVAGTQPSVLSQSSQGSLDTIISLLGGPARHSLACLGQRIDWMDVEQRLPSVVDANLPSVKPVPNEATLLRCWYAIRTHFELKPLNRVLEDLEVSHAARPHSEGGGRGVAEDPSMAVLRDRRLNLTPALMVKEFLTARGERLAHGDGNEPTWAVLEAMLSEHMVYPRARPLPSFGTCPPIGGSVEPPIGSGGGGGGGGGGGSRQRTTSAGSISLLSQDEDPTSADAWKARQVLWPKPQTRTMVLSLHAACAQGNAERCRELARMFYDSLDGPDDQGMFPLHIVARHGHLECAYVLLQAGVMLDAPDPQGNTALHLAATQSGAQRMVELLVTAGAKVSAENAYGETPLHLACRHGAIEAVQMLLSKKASVSPATSGGFTPLHYAAGGKIGSAGPITKLLLDAGADRFALTHFGHTPLERAAMAKTHDSVSELASWDPSRKKKWAAAGKKVGKIKRGKK